CSHEEQQTGRFCGREAACAGQQLVRASRYSHRKAYVYEKKYFQRHREATKHVHQRFSRLRSSRRLRSTARCNSSINARPCSVTVSTRNEIGAVGSAAEPNSS